MNPQEKNVISVAGEIAATLFACDSFANQKEILAGVAYSLSAESARIGVSSEDFRLVLGATAAQFEDMKSRTVAAKVAAEAGAAGKTVTAEEDDQGVIVFVIG